jgi:hypothetical protein
MHITGVGQGQSVAPTQATSSVAWIKASVVANTGCHHEDFAVAAILSEACLKRDRSSCVRFFCEASHERGDCEEPKAFSSDASFDALLLPREISAGGVGDEAAGGVVGDETALGVVHGAGVSAASALSTGAGEGDRADFAAAADFKAASEDSLLSSSWVLSRAPSR